MKYSFFRTIVSPLLGSSAVLKYWLMSMSVFVQKLVPNTQICTSKIFVIKSFMFGHFCIRPLNMLTLFLSYGHHFLSLVFNAIFDFLGVSSPNSHQSKTTLPCKLFVGPLTLKVQSRPKKGAMAIWLLSVKGRLQWSVALSFCGSGLENVVCETCGYTLWINNTLNWHKG